MEIRCICGYGPQENHSVERKKKFWSRLTIEVEEAIENEKELSLIEQREKSRGRIVVDTQEYI